MAGHRSRTWARARNRTLICHRQQPHAGGPLAAVKQIGVAGGNNNNRGTVLRLQHLKNTVRAQRASGVLGFTWAPRARELSLRAHSMSRHRYATPTRGHARSPYKPGTITSEHATSPHRHATTTRRHAESPHRHATSRARQRSHDKAVPLCPQCRLSDMWGGRAPDMRWIRPRTINNARSRHRAKQRLGYRTSTPEETRTEHSSTEPARRRSGEAVPRGLGEPGLQPSQPGVYPVRPPLRHSA